MFSKEINHYRHFVLFAKGHYTKACGSDEDWWKILRKVTINYLSHNYGVDIMSDYHFTLNAMNAVYANNPISVEKYNQQIFEQQTFDSIQKMFKHRTSDDSPIQYMIRTNCHFLMVSTVDQFGESLGSPDLDLELNDDGTEQSNQHS